MVWAIGDSQYRRGSRQSDDSAGCSTSLLHCSFSASSTPLRPLTRVTASTNLSSGYFKIKAYLTIFINCLGVTAITSIRAIVGHVLKTLGSNFVFTAQSSDDWWLCVWSVGGCVFGWFMVVYLVVG